jgi:hypothetical protein
MSEDLDQIEEARRVVRVSSKGDKTRRLKCRAGFKLEGDRCVPMSGSEKRTRRVALRKAVRTKRGNPTGQKRASRKRLKALRKRRSYGL